MKKARIATYLANILDHFDTSLYGFLVPILAPLFFPKSEPIIALLQGYGIVIIGFPFKGSITYLLFFYDIH